MNFPTILQYLRRGTPVARSSWAGSADTAPTRWLNYQGGLIWKNEPGTRAPITREDITESDLRARDWVIPPAGALDLPERPDFPATATDGATAPLFDVFNPPGRLPFG